METHEPGYYEKKENGASTYYHVTEDGKVKALTIQLMPSPIFAYRSNFVLAIMKEHKPVKSTKKEWQIAVRILKNHLTNDR